MSRSPHVFFALVATLALTSLGARTAHAQATPAASSEGSSPTEEAPASTDIEPQAPSTETAAEVSSRASLEPSTVAPASGPAANQAAPPASPIVGLDLTNALPAPLDPTAFPALPAPPIARPFFELHGYLNVWATLVQDAVPTIAERDSLRLRWAILRVDAHPIEHVDVLVRVGFQAPSNPLLDFFATWGELDALQVTVGQMRLPFGASATTPAPQLVFLDRPRYVQDFLKSTFRDVGVMLHSGPRGLLDGTVHYRAAVMNGGGRLGVGASRGLDEPERFLYVGRVLVDAGRVVTGGARDRLVLAASYARSRDPAIDTGDAATDRTLADSVLGRRLVPFASERETQLVGADLTFAAAGFWAQAEWMFLDSVALVAGASHVHATGASLELAYTPDLHPYRGASLSFGVRGEYEDPDLDRSGNETGTVLGGVDFTAGLGIRVGAFGGATVFHDTTTNADRASAELTARAAYGF